MGCRREANPGIFLLFWILLFLLMVSSVSAYSRSSFQYTSPGAGSFGYLGRQGITISPSYLWDKDKCEAGQDFIIQVDPLGCEPGVVRSDLLEEQNVPVFCPLRATKLNPLIDVEAIDYISFKGKYPKQVSGVGFYPARAAIKGSYKTLLNSPVLGNIGYAVIVLKKQKNESEMPEWVEGNLTATIRYDVKNAFGIGKATYYLPEFESELEWKQKYRRYGLWNGRGFLRAEVIDENSASVSVYLDERQRLSGFNLRKGQTSRMIYLPGFYCMAGMKLRLDSLENPDTRAKLDINGEIVEVGDEEEFLENKCRVKDIEKYGLIKKASIRCLADDRAERFDLMISPRVKLDFKGAKKEGYVAGEFLFDYLNNGKKEYVYLGYIGTTDNTDDEESLIVYLYKDPDNKGGNLSQEKISSIGREVDSALFGIGNIAKQFVKGEGIKEIKYKEEKKVFGKSVKLIGFADAGNAKLSEDARNYYDKAMKDYRTVIDSFPGEKENPNDEVQETFGERALLNSIILSANAKQNKDLKSLCTEFKERYPDSEKDVGGFCSNRYFLSNSEIARRDVLINGRVKGISLKGIYEPTPDEYSAEIIIRGSDRIKGSVQLRKDGIVYLDNNKSDFIQLVSLERDSAKIKVSLSSEDNGKRPVSGTKKLEKGKVDSFGSRYSFKLAKANLKKQAKVSVIPNIRNAETEANFSFKIGIEKRAIQLSPEQIKKRLSNLNETIGKWERISNNLGTAVKGFKAACITTGTVLTLKNLVANFNGKAIARREVMTKEGGWNDRCKKEIEKTGQTLDKCLYDYSREIEQAVDDYAKIIEAKNNEFKKLQEGITTKGLFGTKTVDEDELAKKVFTDERKNRLIEKLKKNFGENIEIDGEKVSVEKIINELNAGTFSVTKFRDLEVTAEASGIGSLKGIFEKQLEKDLIDIYKNIKGNAEQASFAKELSEKKELRGVGVGVYASKDAIKGIYDGGKTTEKYGDISANSNIQAIVHNNKRYLLKLSHSTGNEYNIDKVYGEDGKEIKDGNEVSEIKRRFSKFVKYDASSYTNPFKVTPEVKYWETAPYKGMPALVPFDTKNGWYVATKQTLPVLGGIRNYDDSARITKFELCNVMENGKPEAHSGYGDDECQVFAFPTGRISEFPGLGKSETDRIVKKALRAVEDAQRQYKKGLRGKIKILGENINVGAPAVDVPEMQCQNFMSPKDCYLLFNVCDPVVCPTSRCNLGGTFYVSNVIQSGIFGSAILCTPNAREGIFVPVCLSGLKAGIDGLLSVQKNYRDCLKENLETGKTVGLCDEIHSIYLCEFFWRQALPVSKILAPKAIELAMGQGTRGGGEYLGVQESWRNAENSIEYMTKYYGESSYEAFKVRATDKAGSAFCKTFISARYPTSGKFFDALIEPDVPVQYHAWFQEIPFTTATVPPVSQYKVFYHIYAGKDTGVYYRVYLKGPEGISFYQSNPTITVPGATGYIPRGEYASQTKEFTAVSGYQELCINVNGREECGFKQASTSFAVDYVKDRYMKEQASKTGIKTEKECIAGSSSLYSFVTPNLQEGAQEAMNPALYSRGITRVCSTESPGKATDPYDGGENSRWVDVGYCGNKKMRCWLDTNTVKDIIQSAGITNETLDKVSKDAIEKLKEEGNYLDFGKVKEEIEKMKDSEITDYITEELIGKAFLNKEKAYLYLKRGDAYMNLALKKEFGEVDGRDAEKPSASNERKDSRAKFVEKIISYKNNCGEYAGDVYDSAKKNGVDPYLAMAVMVQESNCNPDAENENSYGLMQIEQKSAEEVCSGLGDFDEFKSGKENSKRNIECGIRILKNKYKSFSHSCLRDSDCKNPFNSNEESRCESGKCEYHYSPSNKYYSEWDAALRAYNGWDSGGDDDYVENVMNGYRKLTGDKSAEDSAEETSSSSPKEQKTYKINSFGFVVNGKRGFQTEAATNDDISFVVNHDCDSVQATVYINDKWISQDTPFKDARPFKGNKLDLGKLPEGEYYVSRVYCLKDGKISSSEKRKITLKIREE